ncbi:MAG: hypothetical protein IJX91_05270 [Clostridia bacterium]|nr:hypothetical protein [Clostridia bacterium]
MNIWQRIKSKFRVAKNERRRNVAGLVFPLLCKVRGVKTAERQGALAQSRAGDKLQLVHVALKDYPHNVYVYNVPLNRVLGYLQRDLAEKLVYALGKGFCRDGEIENVTGEEYGTRGANIRIFDTAEAFSGETDFSHLHGS